MACDSVQRHHLPDKDHKIIHSITVFIRHCSLSLEPAKFKNTPTEVIF